MYSSPTGLTFDTVGNLYVANRGTGNISKVNSAGTVISHSFATGLSNARHCVFDPLTNNIYVANYLANEIAQVNATTGGAVTTFKSGVNGCTGICLNSNGDIFVSLSNTKLSGLKRLGAKLSRKIKTQDYGDSPDKIILFKDANKDGVPESQSVFLENLNQPLGMLIIGNNFYVANTDGIMLYNYTPGASSVSAAGKKIVELPAGGYNNHWTRNIITNAAKDKIYIAVGSGSNIAEHGMKNEIRRANILEINTDGSGEKIYASGLRNPVGMGWAPGTQTLWTVVMNGMNWAMSWCRII